MTDFGSIAELRADLQRQDNEISDTIEASVETIEAMKIERRIVAARRETLDQVEAIQAQGNHLSAPQNQAVVPQNQPEGNQSRQRQDVRGPVLALDTSVVEEWVPAPDWPTYEVSSIGRLRRTIPFMSRPAGALVRGSRSRGYPSVVLRRANGEKVSVRIHQLVCVAFHGPRPSPEHEVAHNDGNRENNSAANLRWATRADNHADKLLHDTHNRGERHGLSKLTNKEARAIIAEHSNGATNGALAKKYNVGKTTIFHLLAGDSWAWLQDEQHSRDDREERRVPVGGDVPPTLAVPQPGAGAEPESIISALSQATPAASEGGADAGGRTGGSIPPTGANALNPAREYVDPRTLTDTSPESQAKALRAAVERAGPAGLSEENACVDPIVIAAAIEAGWLRRTEDDRSVRLWIADDLEEAPEAAQ